MRPRPAWAGIVVGAAGFAGGLAATYAGMHDLLKTTGGFCASGGPYQIRNPCPKDDTELLLFGILAMLVFGAVLAYFVGRCDGSVVGVGLLMWAGLFGVLGFGFLEAGNSVITGVVFELMALGGLAGAVSIFLDWVRHPEDHGKAMFDYSGVVMANPPRQPQP